MGVVVRETENSQQFLCSVSYRERVECSGIPHTMVKFIPLPSPTLSPSQRFTDSAMHHVTYLRHEDTHCAVVSKANLVSDVQH